jgi:hypothetical protein
MRVTPEIIEATYVYIRSLPPFNRWNLPEADDVQFHVTHSLAWRGDHQIDGEHIVRISARRHSHLSSIVETVAHEAIHVHIDGKGLERATHGKVFMKLARQVCRLHGFDFNGFVP